MIALGALTLAGAQAQAGDAWVSSGVGGSEDSFHTYGGATYAPFGRLDESGWRLRAWSKAFRFTYDTSVAPGTSAEITVNGLGLEGETGWYVKGQNWNALGLIGIVWRDHELSQPDPSSSLTRSKLGGSMAFEASYQIAENWRISGDARYVLGFDELWMQVRPEVTLDYGFNLGVTASSSLGDGYAVARSGLTFGNLSHDFRWLGRVYFSGEAGYEHNIDTGKAGPFGGLHIGFRY